MSRKGIAIANAIRTNASAEYQKAVPFVGDNAKIQDISEPILNYEPFMNEFVNGLVNRIAFTMFTKKNAYSNPLNVFKKGKIPLGMDVQNIFTNPATGMPYEMSSSAMSKLLQVYDPDTKVEYFRRNRQWVYPVTISNDQLSGAFVSWEALEELIAQITNSLYSGNYIDEFEITKDLLSQAVTNNKMITLTVGDVTDEASAKNFVKTARKLFLKMGFPSTDYNAYSKLGGQGTPVKTWTESDRVALLITADALTEIDVEVLAKAFNLTSSQLMGKIHVVDKFSNDNIIAVLCDESFIQIYDNLYKFTTFYNGATLTWNYFFHAWNTFAISSFANAVALLKEDQKITNLTSLALANPTAKIHLASPLNVELVYTPTDATVTNITCVNTKEIDKEHVTITKVDNKHFTITADENYTQGTVDVKFVADNGVELTHSFTVSDN